MAEGPTGILSTVALAGAIVFAGGAIVGATIHFALADYSDNTDVVDPLVFQALNAFDWSSFLFFPVGLFGAALWVLAVSIVWLRQGEAPRAAVPG